jgi:LSD1 subclass zinc finger protein
MLVFPCPSCGAKLQMAEDLAGKKVRCASCQAVVSAPEKSETSDAITAGPGPAVSSAAISSAGKSGPGPKRSADADEPDRDEDRPAGRRPQGGDVGKAAATTAAVAGGLGIGAVVAIIGGIVAVLCLCGLVIGIPLALLVPAVQKVRESAAKVQTMNNMKQIALASINHADTFRGELARPKSVFPPNNQPVDLSWRVAILPFMEQGALFNQFDKTSAWDSPRNMNFSSTPIHTYEDLLLDPGKKGDATRFQYFTGPGTMWPDNSIRRFPAGIPDGTSNTFLFAEASSTVPWAKPADMVIKAEMLMEAEAPPLPKDHFLAAMADGSVHMIDRSRVSNTTVLLYINPADGRAVPRLD